MLGFAKRFSEQAKLFADQELKKMYPIPPSVQPSSVMNRPITSVKPASASKRNSRPSGSSQPRRPIHFAASPITPVRRDIPTTRPMAVPSPVPSLSSSTSSPVSTRNPMTPTFATPDSVLGPPTAARHNIPAVIIDLTSNEPHHQNGLLSLAAPKTPRLTQPRAKEKLTPSSWAVVKHSKPTSHGTPEGSAMKRRKSHLVRMQFALAQELARRGDKGPFEVGDYLCAWDAQQGKLRKRATRTFSAATGRDWWLDLKTGRPFVNVGIIQQYTEVYGTPVSNADGSLAAFEGMQTGPTVSRGLHPKSVPLQNSWDPMLSAPMTESWSSPL